MDLQPELKDTMKHLEEAEDEQYEVLSYEEEKYGAMLMNCNVISQVCDIIVLTFTFPVLGWKKHREKSSPDSWQPVLCFVINFFLYGYYQMRYVKIGSGSSPGEERRYELKKLTRKTGWQVAMRQKKRWYIRVPIRPIWRWAR